jgi:hypothetical protein
MVWYHSIVPYIHHREETLMGDGDGPAGHPFVCPSISKEMKLGSGSANSSAR